MSPAQKTCLSIAMCTYNGERFLSRQLATILRQTRLPDELVIRDDRSTDNTPSIIAEFAHRAPFTVDFQVNPLNLGSTRNFERCILACRGDLIALADQDDLWQNDRLELSERAFLNHPETGLVFSDGELIDDLDRPIGQTLWQTFNFNQSSIEKFQTGDYLPLARRTFVTGATVMLRAHYANLCFPTGARWLHDGWLAMLVACMAPIRPLNEKLISYRLHASQQVGLGTSGEAGNPLALDSLQMQATQQAASLAINLANIDEVCHAIGRLPLTEEQRLRGPAAAFIRHRDFLAMRLALPSNRMRRLPELLDSIETYRTSAMGALSVAKDLALPGLSS